MSRGCYVCTSLVPLYDAVLFWHKATCEPIPVCNPYFGFGGSLLDGGGRSYVFHCVMSIGKPCIDEDFGAVEAACTKHSLQDPSMHLSMTVLLYICALCCVRSPGTVPMLCVLQDGCDEV